MIEYWITGVWKDGNGVITHVLIHPSDDGRLSNGERLPEASVITLIEAGATVYTCRWNYTKSKWHAGAQVVIIKETGGHKHLRTVGDAIVTDNLDNMISMSKIVR